MRQKVNPEVNTRAAAVYRPKVVQKPRLTELLLQVPRKGAHVVGDVQGLRAWFEIVARTERELRTAIRRVGQIRDRMVRQVKSHHASLGVVVPQQESDAGLPTHLLDMLGKTRPALRPPHRVHSLRKDWKDGSQVEHDRYQQGQSQREV